MGRTFLLILFLFSFSFADQTCKALTGIFDECVYNQEYSCEQKQVMVYYSLVKTGKDISSAKKITSLCGFYCQNPSYWNREVFYKNCQSKNR